MATKEQKKLAAQSARALSRIREQRLKEVFDTFCLNPSAKLYVALTGAATDYQDARNREHEIAEWEVEEN